MDTAVISPVTESLLDKPVTLEDFAWFCLICAWLTHMQFTTISNVAKFHRMWKEMYRSLDIHSWVWKQADVTDDVWVEQIYVTSVADKPHHQGHKPLSFPNCNQNLSASQSYSDEAGAKMKTETFLL